MQTKLPEITPIDLKAIRDFLIGITDEVQTAPRTTKSSHRSRAAVRVSQGISRARIRSVKVDV